MPRYEKTTRIAAPAKELAAWHLRRAAFERLVPPWERVELRSFPPSIEQGSLVELGVRIGPLTQKWTAEIAEVRAGRGFVDQQIVGPFARWRHEHLFEPDGGGTLMTDRVDFRLPLQPLSGWVAGCHVKNTVRRLFAYRHAIVQQDFDLRGRQPLEPRRIVMTGASGLIGSALEPFLHAGGHSVTRLVRSRRQASQDTVLWDAREGFPEGTEKLEGHDVVIHLAGASIAGGRWTEERKKLIRDSRVQGTRTLSEALAKLKRPPKLLICSSAIGIYGETTEPADEDSPTGTGFLAETGCDWEAATQAAADAGIRVVLLRTGVVLSPAGGALKMMLPIFKLGLGGRLGDGTQAMSWVAIDDVLGAVWHIMGTEELRGAVNMVGPNPVSNSEFTRTLDRVLRRPVGPPAPRFALSAMFGEMADEALLKSVDVRPKRLLSSGYQFFHPDLEDALRHVLGRTIQE